MKRFPLVHVGVSQNCMLFRIFCFSFIINHLCSTVKCIIFKYCVFVTFIATFNRFIKIHFPRFLVRFQAFYCDQVLLSSFASSRSWCLIFRSCFSCVLDRSYFTMYESCISHYSHSYNCLLVLVQKSSSV